MIFRQRFVPCHRPLRKPIIFGDHGFGMARKGIFSNRSSLWPGGGEGVDLLLADEQGDVMAAFCEHLTHGDAGEQMPSRATARDEDVNVGLFHFQGW
jgi:hypothetical protein